MEEKCRKKSFYVFNMALTVFVTLFVLTACAIRTCRSSSTARIQQFRCDTLMRESVGDSICMLLMESQNVKVTALKFVDDSVRSSVGQEMKLNKSQRDIVRFILVNRKNCLSDSVVYGKFFPSFWMKFVSGCQACTLNFDFALRKWNICDSKGKMLVQYDLKTDEMLRFACILYPDCTYFNSLLNKEGK